MGLGYGFFSYLKLKFSKTEPLLSLNLENAVEVYLLTGFMLSLCWTVEGESFFVSFFFSEVGNTLFS